MEGDGGVVELLAEEALGERAEVFAGLGQREGVGRVVPLQLEGGGERGDPDLADGGVGGEDELGRAVFEEDVEDAVLLLGLETAVFLGADEGLLEGVEGFVGLVAEGGFVDHAEFSVLGRGVRLVARAGVQPATFALGVRCSMQLSYRATVVSVPMAREDIDATFSKGKTSFAKEVGA